MTPVTWLASRVIPVTVVQKVIEGADFLAQSATDGKDIMRDGQVSSIDELRIKTFSFPTNWRMKFTMVDRYVGGFRRGAWRHRCGWRGVRCRALIVLSLRTIHKIGLCSGYERLNEQLVLGVLSVSSASSRQEKKSAIELMRYVETLTVREVMEDAAKEAVLTSVARGGVFSPHVELANG